MYCPKCSSSSRVISINKKKPGEIRRYRKCTVCDHKFVTTQGPEEIAQRKQVLYRKGEEHPNSKLTNDTVREMRALAATGVSSFECGLIWDVSQKVAWNAIVGRTWKHVA